MQTTPLYHLPLDYTRNNLSNPKESTGSFAALMQDCINKGNTNEAIFSNIKPLKSESAYSPFFVSPVHRLNETFFIKGTEDGVLSIDDLNASIDEIYTKFNNKLKQKKINVKELELLTDDKGDLAILNSLPKTEKNKILNIFSKDPEFQKLFNQMQFVAKLRQHPELFSDFTRGYKENPLEALTNYNKLFDEKDNDEIFILSAKGNEYQITLKKITIDDIKNELDKAVLELDNKLRKMLLDNHINLPGEINLQYDANKGKITMVTDSPNRQKSDDLISEHQGLTRLLNKINFLTGIVQNPDTLSSCVRSYLLGSYQLPEDYNKILVLTMNGSKYKTQLNPQKECSADETAV